MGTSHEMQRRIRVLRITGYLSRHWLLIFLILYGLFVFLPFLAPVFMNLGWSAEGNRIYDMYAVMCHQMAQRSFFLFGEKVMYNADQLPLRLTGASSDALLLRHFRGNETYGWKVAWSDRMVSMYGGIWLAGLVYGLLSRTRSMKPLKWWWLILLVLPMAVDGGTHMISDTTSGLFEGFRYRNEWLAILTGHALPDSFYAGDALGSFNSSVRLISGLLFGFGIVGFIFPYLDGASQELARDSAEKLNRWYENERRLREMLKRSPLQSD